MGVIEEIKIECCYQCRHRDHSGAFTPGGAVILCRHPNRDKRKDNKYRAQTIHDANKLPSHCPLRKKGPVQQTLANAMALLGTLISPEWDNTYEGMMDLPVRGKDINKARYLITKYKKEMT